MLVKGGKPPILKLKKMRKIKNTTKKIKFEEISIEGDKGQSIESQLREVMNNETTQGITETSPIIYTERKEGVLPEYNIRTDIWEVARKAMGTVSGKYRHDRMERLKGTELQKPNESEVTKAS